MKIIALVAVAGVILLELSGSIPKGSVGGAMALALANLAAAVAVGLHEAWAMGRGIVGWIVNVVMSIIGGVVAAVAGGTFTDALMSVAAPALNIQGSLMSTRHPLLYVLLAVTMIITLTGAWLALQLVNRFRSR